MFLFALWLWLTQLCAFRDHFKTAEAVEIDHEMAHHPSISPLGNRVTLQLCDPIRIDYLANRVISALDVPCGAVGFCTLAERPWLEEDHFGMPSPPVVVADHRQDQTSVLVEQAWITDRSS